MKKGFTLIELLIVVLIIAILAAIAVPNFLEFQTRAKVARVKNDQRSIATAIEAYYVDNNEYPAMTNGNEGANSYPFVGKAASGGSGSLCTFRLRISNDLSTMTTPVQYITSYFADPFAEKKGTTFGFRQFRVSWILTSYGPDRDENTISGQPGDIQNRNCVVNNAADPCLDQNFETAFNLCLAQPSLDFLTGVGVLSANAITYDPTNGTTSEGDVYRIKQ